MTRRKESRVMRVLITGMSGTGKTAVIEELAARGHRAIDLDTLEWSEWIDVDPTDTLTPRKGKDWIWQEDKVRALLAGHNQGTLFVSGCAQNMARLFPLIDMIVLLSAPATTIMKRPESRASNGYGNTEEERRKVRELIAAIEPQRDIRQAQTRSRLRSPHGLKGTARPCRNRKPLQACFHRACTGNPARDRRHPPA
jgi:broad-specificity NMP kinase